MNPTFIPFILPRLHHSDTGLILDKGSVVGYIRLRIALVFLENQ